MTDITYTHNYTYLIINLTNGLKYIGVRSCNCLPENDPYMGSSKSLNEVIKSSGASNFHKLILSLHDTREEAVSEEIRLHDLHDVALNPKFYNLAKQTTIGFDTTGMKFKHSEESIARHSAAKKLWHQNNSIEGENNPFYGKKHSEETLKHMSEIKTGSNHPMYGTHRSQETKDKIGLVHKGKVVSQETRDKLSASHRKVYTCPHCNTSGGRMMLRWHFDNCKSILQTTP